MCASQTHLPFHDYTGFPHPALRFHAEKTVVPVRHVAEHRHAFGELVIVRQGDGVHRVLAGEHRIGPGDAFYIPMGWPHAYRDLNQLDLWVIDFDPEVYLRPVEELDGMSGALKLFGPDWPPGGAPGQQNGGFCLHLDRGVRSMVDGLAESLLKAYTCAMPGARAEMRARFTLLLVCLIRYGTEPRSLAESGSGPLAKVLAFIEDRYAEPLSLELLSQAACTSRSSLQRAFRRRMHCTPMQYVMGRRIDRARELLASTDMSVTAIAEGVGFADSNHFSRRFAQRCGMSPRTYRNHLTPPGLETPHNAQEK